MNDDTAEPASLLEFPCRFPIKVMGLSQNNIDLVTVEIVRKHAPDLTEGAVKSRASRGGKYTSVTVTINAVSRAQLDAIYQDLVDHDQVLLAF